jgi:hypothetical protein
MDRRFFILTPKGEVGPLDLAEMQEGLEDERLRDGDRVRTALGQQLGTIGEILGTTARTTSDRRLIARPPSDRIEKSGKESSSRLRRVRHPGGIPGKKASEPRLQGLPVQRHAWLTVIMSMIGTLCFLALIAWALQF